MGTTLSRVLSLGDDKNYRQQLEEIERRLSAATKRRSESEGAMESALFVVTIYGTGFYAFVVLLVYAVFKPQTFKNRLMTGMFLILFPVIIHYSRKLIRWYHQRNIDFYSNVESDLNHRKREVLQQIKQNEKYSVAKELLERYGQQVLRDSPTYLRRRKTVSTPAVPHGLVTNRQPSTILTSRQPVTGWSNSTCRNNPYADRRASTNYPFGQRMMTPNYNLPAIASSSDYVTSLNNALVANTAHQWNEATKKPSFFNRIIDAIEAGCEDKNTKALVCQQCNSHNGLIPKNYLNTYTYKCVYCHYINQPLFESESQVARTTQQQHPLSCQASMNYLQSSKTPSPSNLFKQSTSAERQGARNNRNSKSSPKCLPPVHESSSDSSASSKGQGDLCPHREDAVSTEAFTTYFSQSQEHNNVADAE